MKEADPKAASGQGFLAAAVFYGLSVLLFPVSRGEQRSWGKRRKGNVPGVASPPPS